MKNNFYQTNELISNILQSRTPASILRIDNTMGYIFDCVSRQEPISEEFFNPQELYVGGIYPNTYEYFFEKLFPVLLSSMEECDILGFVDIGQRIETSSPLLEYFSEKNMFFRDGFLIMDPGALLGYAQKEYNTYLGPAIPDLKMVPWTSHLKNKKVLVISTHVDSINYQWNRIETVWGDKKDLIVPFELVGTIRAPYNPDFDNRQYPNCTTWLDMIEKMKEHIDKIDYDVVLCGATALSPIIAAHAKKRGKVGIQTGGTLQLFFGIVGSRWLNEPHYRRWHDMFNKNWIYPLDSDKPQNMQVMKTKETGNAYW